MNNPAFDISLCLAVMLSAMVATVAIAQPFSPNLNPVSNQGWNAAVIVTGTSYTASRAVFNGNASACNITFTMNGGASVQFQNVQPGEILPIQTTQVSATTCTAGTLVEIF